MVEADRAVANLGWARGGSVRPSGRAGLPDWLVPVADFAERVRAEDLTRFLPTDGQGRHSAVLVLFGPRRDVLLIERASTLRAHAGQPAFPGGGLESQDADAAAAALREAREETGLDPAGVEVFGALPDLWVPVSDYVVSPVLAWWARPSAVHAADPREVARVHRVRIEDLISPENRYRVRHPSGYVGPAFAVDGMLVWGFTAGLLAGLLDGAGWAQPWDASRVVDLPGYAS